MIKLLYYNDLAISNRVVSKISTLSSLYILSYYYYLLIIYNNLTTLLSYYISILYKGSKLLFFALNLATLLFFSLKSTCAAYFCTRFYLNFEQKSKKICQFFAIFSRCVSIS